MEALRSIRQLAIIGPGLLGGSLGLALKQRGYTGRIVGVSRRPSTWQAAQRLGCIDDGGDDVAAAVRDSQLAVLCTPLGTFDAVLAQIAPVAHAELILTDVGSTKLSVLEAARRRLPAEQLPRFVAAHPMAGSEQQGPEHADEDLFVGKPCIICRETQTDPAAAATVEALFRIVGMNLLWLSAEEHDRRSALISHLPHLAAVMLMLVADRHGGLDIASTGFRDTTRLASSNPPMRADIIAANREQILQAMQAFSEQMDELIMLLDNGDDAVLLERLQHAKAARDAWRDQRDRHQT